MTRALRSVLRLALLCCTFAPAALFAGEPPPPIPAPLPAPTPNETGSPAAPPSPAPDGAGPVMRLHVAEAAAMGLARNLELAAGGYDPEIARGALCDAEGAFDPLLSVSINAGRSETLPNQSFFATDVLQETLFGADTTLSKRLSSGGTVSLVLHADRLLSNSGIATINPRWVSGVTLQATQPLLRGAGDVALTDIRRAKNGILAGDYAYRALAEDVLLRIETAYWNLAFATEQVTARAKSEEVSRGLMDLEASRLDAKVATPLDVAEARAGLEARRGDRIVAEGARGAAEDALRALILPFERGHPLAITLIAIDDPREAMGGAAPQSVLPPSPAEEERYVALALNARPDLLASRAELENRDIDVRVAEDGLAPQLDLFGRISTSGLDRGFSGAIGNATEGEAGSGTVGIVFSMYLGRRSAAAKVQMASYGRRQAALRHRDLENQIIAEVRNAIRDEATARARLGAAGEEIRSAREALDGERERQTHGESTPFRVLEKEERLTAAITREGRAAADVRIARARLAKSVGTMAQSLRVVLPSTR